MARKKPKEEHENLERWLVSYADFITLLFATFVVLYALSQIDITEFQKLEESISRAFKAPSIMQGDVSVLNGKDSIMEQTSGDSIIAPLMMEYMSAKYEDMSYKEISQSIERMQKKGELEGVEVEITDKGLVIRIEDDNLYPPGSATLTLKAKKSLDKIGTLISEKFVIHQIRIEGHSDNTPIKSAIFPSNWELSSARASTVVRYFIARFKFMPALFTAVGYSDTKPIGDNSTEKGRAKNRRVEILVLKNKLRAQENDSVDIMKMNKSQQEQLNVRRLEALNTVKTLSPPAKDLAGGSIKREEQVIILNQAYEKENKRIIKQVAPVKKDITGANDWLKPPAAIDINK